MKVALVTVNIGGFDEVIKPITQSMDYDYYYFTEYNLPFPLVNLIDDRMRARYIKTQMHDYLSSEYDIFIWIDGRIEITSEDFIKNYVELLLSGVDIITTFHPDRSNINDEIDFILESIKNNKPYLVERYKNQPLLEEKEYIENNSPGIPMFFASGIFARWNNEKNNKMCNDWWNDCLKFTSLDQATFRYNIHKHNLSFIPIDFKNDLFKLGKHKKKMKELLSINNTLDLIKNALLNKQPLAFIRYGDGEFIVMDMEYNPLLEFVMNRQLGYIPTTEQMYLLKQNLIKAYIQADVIGVPEEKHSNRDDEWGKSISGLKQYVGIDILQHKILASVDTFYKFLTSDFLSQINCLYDSPFEELLKDREVVNYISCRNLDEEIKKKYNIKQVNSFIISPEMKFTSKYEGQKHFTDQYYQIKEWIKEVTKQGDLCLVGAGVVGKIYNIWFKEAGGISLDVGAVFDLWAGRNTRGIGRGMDVTNNVYKL